MIEEKFYIPPETEKATQLIEAIQKHFENLNISDNTKSIIKNILNEIKDDQSFIVNPTFQTLNHLIKPSFSFKDMPFTENNESKDNFEAQAKLCEYIKIKRIQEKTRPTERSNPHYDFR